MIGHWLLSWFHPLTLRPPASVASVASVTFGTLASGLHPLVLAVVSLWIHLALFSSEWRDGGRPCATIYT